MKKRFEKLIDVKSISTLVLTGVFSYLSIIGKISPELFMTIFTVVIGFYYGTQKEKKDNDNNMNIQGTEDIRSRICFAHKVEVQWYIDFTHGWKLL